MRKTKRVARRPQLRREEPLKEETAMRKKSEHYDDVLVAQLERVARNGAVAPIRLQFCRKTHLDPVTGTTYGRHRGGCIESFAPVSTGEVPLAWLPLTRSKSLFREDTKHGW